MSQPNQRPAQSKNEQLTINGINLHSYFEKVREIQKSGKDYPINLDDVYSLVYSRRDKAVKSLKDNFIEDEDFIIASPNGGAIRGGKNKIDYFLSVPAMEFFIAKKVKEVFEVYRQVFHKVLDQKEQFTIPQTFSEALKLASMQAEKLEIQDQQIKKMLPRSEFVDVVFNTDKLLQGSEVCKLLNLPFGNITLYKRLRELGIFFKDRNEPMQRYVDAGYFRLKEEYVPNLENFIIRAYFTQKGLGFIAKKFNALQSFALLQNPQI